MNMFKCTQCSAHKYCRRHSISKGSKICSEKRGLTKPEPKQKASTQKSSLLWDFYNKVRNKK